MSFVVTTATRLGIPHATVRRATATLMARLCERADHGDVQTLLEVLPEFGEHADVPSQPAGLQRLVRRIVRFGREARATRTDLQRTGLGYVDVAFVSAFAGHLREHLGTAMTARLVDSVPGLAAMTSWPVLPHKQDRHQAASPDATGTCPADRDRSAPRTMS